ncbi:CGGC domain-containing protein [Desulfosporosinus meridiei]|uniref:Putative metal-binding protein n=1 Tax=Desulfosporosinus meridiei (strain ATCC BAA-275 / DSM 13257 / KCTC 12902 / NCIMB 13706 / S10) TaxID=768704 RepID=J7IR00_DESMD|nr:CGGC domain-containing protein [Desulfosporosinus meridiei]AFQ42609.1 putative metal-binding protein [Desulfosporosinus meridiei DSM 13257]
MIRVAIFSCPKVTNKMGCSSSDCLDELRNRQGSYTTYDSSENLELIGMINCPGCPAEIDSQRIINQIQYLSKFKVNKIHFTNCMSLYCAFRYNYQVLIEGRFPNIEIVQGKYETVALSCSSKPLASGMM